MNVIPVNGRLMKPNPRSKNTIWTLYRMRCRERKTARSECIYCPNKSIKFKVCQFCRIKYAILNRKRRNENQ